MKKNIIIAVLVCLITLTGCNKNYSKKDIKKYINENIKISGYKITGDKKEIKGADGKVDYYYPVKYKDIEFYVIDDNYDGMWGEDTLSDNFTEKVIEYYYNKNGKNYNIIFKKNPSYNENHIDGFIRKELVCEVVYDGEEFDETTLKECYDNTTSFIKTIDMKTYPLKDIEVILLYDVYGKEWDTSTRTNYIFKDGKMLTYEEFKNN